ncbi:hypothetical protein NQ314_012251 [Rhamnusium bicolor]|uniref:Uncharacterized protein n=1 Tax=Rhamnusium bicolor TaxID=1586634 RepID=A0AAV8XDC3_9CUCU|nr:hypothetical protein NQ314_012251 [Rhamnusium bicolor]
MHSITVSKNPTETSPQADTTQKSPELPADQVFTLKPTPISSKAEDFARAPTKSDLEQKIDPSDQQFDDFTSYQSTGELQPHTSWPSIVPLRETYISNENLTSNLNIKELPLDIEGWLQPTIVSPELPRKDLVIGEEELPNIQTPELTRKSVSGETIEDDFDEFQMVLPGNENTGSERTIITNNSDILQPIKPELILPQQALRNFEFPDLTSFEIEPVVKKSEGKPSKNDLEVDIAEENKQDTFDDDEFTDFHFSTPVSQPIISKPITPILEPLKPVPVYPIVTSTPSTQINWPDPGITEEEIKKFEMVFSRPKESKNEEPKKVKDETKKLSSANSIDDDEWSDFVSVQKPSPVHKFQLNERERTSSPDLPLSVLNLSSIQPAKQPIPVITPQGLVQTKLSSNSTITMSPKTHSKNNVLSMQNKHLYQQPQIQPSIISNQYASQAYNFNSGYYNQNTKAELNFSLNQQQKSLDEDDWSDFVSNPIPQTSANGYQQNWQNTSSHHQSGWTTAPPNIITNPGHFVQSGSDLKNRKVSNVSVNSKKSTIPSISLPELEFIGPKGRTSSSRKK